MWFWNLVSIIKRYLNGFFLTISEGERQEFENYYLSVSLKRFWLISIAGQIFILFLFLFHFFFLNVKLFTPLEAIVCAYFFIILIVYRFFINPNKLSPKTLVRKHFALSRFFILATLSFGLITSVYNFEESGFVIYLIIVLILGNITNASRLNSYVVPVSFLLLYFATWKLYGNDVSFLDFCYNNKYSFYLFLFIWLVSKINYRSQKDNFMLLQTSEFQNHLLQKEIDDNRLLSEELSFYKEQLEGLVDEKTRELQDAKSIAEKSDKLKSHFLANISHEIRTPLNAIIGYANIITLSEVNDKKREECKEIIVENTHKLLDQINNVLIFSKLETGNLSLLNSNFGINNLFHVVYENWKRRFSAIGGTFETNVTLSLIDGHDRLYSDKAMISFCLNSLLNNAFRYSNGRGVYFGYEITPKGRLSIYVKDDGAGIPEKEQSLIFDPFYQGINDDEDESVTKGTGLGLNIVKRITTLMGGKVDVQSTEGNGATFCLILPYLEAESKKVNSEIIKLPYLPNYNTLFIDNALITMDYYKVLINETGAEHVMCTSVESARDYLQLKFKLDIIFIGLKPRNSEVIALISYIKEVLPEIPIIALVSIRESGIISDLPSLGFTDYIEKPVSRKMLYPILNKYLLKKDN